MRLRWDELTTAERKNFASLAMGLISEFASPQEEWALKSQTAALVAEVFILSFCAGFWLPFMHLTKITHTFPINLLQVVRREGIDFWHDLLPSLITLSHNGPAEVNFSPFFSFFWPVSLDWNYIF